MAVVGEGVAGGGEDVGVDILGQGLGRGGLPGGKDRAPLLDGAFLVDFAEVGHIGGEVFQEPFPLGEGQGRAFGLQVHGIPGRVGDAALVEVSAGVRGGAVGELGPVGGLVIDENLHLGLRAVSGEEPGPDLGEAGHGLAQALGPEGVEPGVVHSEPGGVPPDIGDAEGLFPGEGVIGDLLVGDVVQIAALAVPAAGGAVPPGVEVEDQGQVRVPARRKM